MFFKNIFRRRKIGLALSGGGARGFAHLGVLKVIEEKKIPIEFIAGTSSGALIGAIYASGMKVSEIIERALKVKWADLTKIGMSKTGLVSSAGIESFMLTTIGDKFFSDLKIPLAVVTTDIKTGEKIVLSRGHVSSAIRASCAFPGIYTPAKHDHRVFIDGALVENLPIDTVRQMGANYVIAVDVIPKVNLKENPKNIIIAIDRSIDIALKRQGLFQKKEPDCLIEPLHEEITSMEIEQKDRLIMLGEECARNALNALP